MQKGVRFLNQRKLIKIELLLSAAMFGFGILMSFSPTMSGDTVWSRLVAGVNHSPWESFKPFMLSFVVFSVAVLGGARLPLARFVCVYVFCLYAYTGLGLFAAVLYSGTTPYNLAYYIAVFVSGTVCRLTAASLMFSKKNRDFFFIPALAALALYILMFLFFTPCPPHTPLFFDNLSGKYGF